MEPADNKEAIDRDTARDQDQSLVEIPLEKRLTGRHQQTSERTHPQKIHASRCELAREKSAQKLQIVQHDVGTDPLETRETLERRIENRQQQI